MRFLLRRIMSYLEVGDFRQIVKNFIGLDGYGADFDIESLSGLFIRLFGGKEEISAIANLLDIEIVAVVKEPLGQRSSFFFEHNDKNFNDFVTSLALDRIENPKPYADIIKSDDGTCCICIPICLKEKCIGYVICGKFYTVNNDSSFVLSSYPIICRRSYEYMVWQICTSGSRIFEYCLNSISKEDFLSRVNYDLFFKYGNYYNFNIQTNKYILSRSTGEILGLKDKERCTLEEFYAMVVLEDRKRITDFFTDEVLCGGNPFSVQTQVVRPIDGKKIWIEIKGVVLKNDQGFSARILGTVSDITELKEIQEKLQRENAAKNRLIRIIGHDLRNPFNALIGFSELLGKSLAQGDYKVAEEYIQIIKQASAEGYDFLVNLLEYSNSVSDDLKLNLQTFPLNVSVCRVIDLLSAQAYRKKIRLVNQVPKDINLCADEYKIATVIRNLVSNAVKFSYKDKDVVIKAEEDSQGKVLITVVDCGVPIDKEKIDKINTAQDVESTFGTDMEKGSSIGLKLCNTFLQLHASKLTVSCENNLTTFGFVI